MSDEALCERAQHGGTEAESELAVRYFRLVKSCVRPYFLAGGDSEDLIQEGMIGLLGAIRSYTAERGGSFASFARVCIQHRVFSAIRSAAAAGQELPMQAGEIAPLFDDNPDAAASASMPGSDPMVLVIGMEEHRERIRALTELLSPLEESVLSLYLEGYSLAEIAQRLGKQIKSVDNALQRIKRKSAALTERSQDSACSHKSSTPGQSDGES
ncbi:MAG: sigma-70 family RNA polymerase sigma factor [Butyricicoccaceae bacterium]